MTTSAITTKVGINIPATKGGKIPGSLGGIRCEQRIRELLERRVPKKRDEHHSDHEHLKCDGLAYQEVGVSHQLRAEIAYYLGRSLLRDKNDAAWLFLRVRTKAGLDFILFHRRPWALRSDHR